MKKHNIECSDSYNGEVMALRQHLRELRQVLVVSAMSVLLFAVAMYNYFDPVIAFLYSPFANIPQIVTGNTLFAHHVFEGFLTRIKISVFVGLIFSSPILIFLLIRFIFPALTKREKRITLWTLISSAALVFGGFYYGYYSILPIAIDFFTSAGFFPDHIGLMLNYERNIMYVFRFLFLVLVTFQLPVLMVILMMSNIIHRGTLFRMGRFVVIGLFLFSAIITPPDFVSQVMIALPMIVLYYFALLVAVIFGFGKEA
ncbi:MAG TPA: twin-arginine translocase subunit TatC [Sediminispirochaeta sp.]|nr:twin-arginine translocase subunit TatC [Sediminispirochaeta sp.]